GRFKPVPTRIIDAGSMTSRPLTTGIVDLLLTDFRAVTARDPVFALALMNTLLGSLRIVKARGSRRRAFSCCREGTGRPHLLGQTAMSGQSARLSVSFWDGIVVESPGGSYRAS